MYKRQTFNIAYSANHSSCRSCLRRSCTLSGAVHRTVRFRMEKAGTTTFCSQFYPQTSTWFDHPAEDSSRTVSYLVRRLQSSSSLQLYVPSSSLIQQLLNIKPPLRVCFQSSTMSNFLGQLYEVLLRRTPLNTRPRRFARLHDLSTMSNSIDKLCHHNGASVQQCRTPSTIQADPSCVQS